MQIVPLDNNVIALGNLTTRQGLFDNILKYRAPRLIARLL